MEWLRTNQANNTDGGIIYFADDDNTYSVDLFNEVSKYYILKLTYNFKSI